MKKIILIVLLHRRLRAAAGYYIYGRFHPKSTDTLSVSGNLELTQVDISFKVPGKLVELDVDEGDVRQEGPW